MERLWGEVLAVPAQRIRVLDGDESLDGFRVAYTPGHASHHVAYLHERSGRAFTGDVAGVRIAQGPVLAPTPPPDIDLQAWRASLDQIERWRPSSLAITHFGDYDDVDAHLQAAREQLTEVERRARDLDGDGFIAAFREGLAGTVEQRVAAAYEQALPPDLSYLGLRRYLAKRS
jgi:glyoxylase-like metal-dependent hydrolase (beta-lactamase superfamily II)